MRILAKLFCAFTFVICISPAYPQARQLGTWRVYLPYKNANAVYDGGDKVYCVTPYSLFTYSKSDGVIQTYDKATGLSDVGVQTSGYDPSSKYLAIAYTDNNLDFIYNGTDIYNLPDIQQYSTTQAITINSIAFYNGNAYLSSSLGISIISLSPIQISETFTIDTSGAPANVYSTTSDGVNIYAATDNGVKYAPLSSPNLQDFNAWQYLTGTQNLPAKKISFVQAYNNKIYAVATQGVAPDSLYAYNGATWSIVPYDTSSLDTDAITSLNVTGGNMYLTAWDNGSAGYGVEGKVDSTGLLASHYTQGHSKPEGWFYNGNVAYEADFYNGLYINNQGNAQNVIPNGPYSANVLSLNVKNGVANVCPGGVNDIWGPTYNRDGFFVYQNGQWNNQNVYTNSIFNSYYSVVSSATVSPRSKTYFGCYGGGLLEYDDNAGNISAAYGPNNSPIEVNPGSGGVVEISALGVDQYNNLWMGNSGTDSCLMVLQADGRHAGINLNYHAPVFRRH